jgi:hypothetical protein
MATVQLKRSAVAGRSPVVGDLALGELAINTTDGKLFIKKSVSGTESIVEIGAGGGGGGPSSPVSQTAFIITENVTFGTGYHGLSLYSAEISAGAAVTVPANSIWTIAIF